MTAGEKINFKTRLKQHCIAVIEQRVANSGAAMQEAQQSANEEEKSSAGDKYETSRAMSHLEKDMHAKQLQSNQQELALLSSIDCSRIYTTVTNGSMIICDGVSFFIAAGLGKILFDEQSIYILSPAAPVSKLLSGKEQGDSITFNGKAFLINDLY